MHLQSLSLAASFLSLGLCTPTGTTLQPQFHVRVAAASGPCPMTRYNSEPCRDMLDSSACWNGIIGPNGGGNADRAEQLWNCVPGGKEYVSDL
jgi:hypothetical protein